MTGLLYRNRLDIVTNLRHTVIPYTPTPWREIQGSSNETLLCLITKCALNTQQLGSL